MQEFSLIQNKKILNLDEVEVIQGLSKVDGRWFCQRCSNEKRFGQFVYQGELITYCRECLDFKQVSQKSLLYRSKRRADLTRDAHVLNVDFQLSALQQEASNFSQQILKTKGKGLIWAVCSASI